MGVFFKRLVLGLVCAVASAGCGGTQSGSDTGLDKGDGENSGVLADAGSGTGGDAGTSSGLAALEVSNAAGFDYGSTLIGTTAEHRFVLRNRGTDTATQLEVTLAGSSFAFAGGTFPGAGGTCGSELAAGASCQVAVAFAPTARGAVNGTLTVHFGNGPVDAVIARTLAGKGLAPALVRVEPASVDFGSVVVLSSSTSWRTVTLTNIGDVDAHQLSARNPPQPFSFKGGYQPGTEGTCWITLAAGESCTLVLGFSPFDVGEARTTLSISYEDGVSFRSLPLVLSGSAVSSAYLRFSDADPFDFGAVTVGTVVEHTFTVTNVGGTAATQLRSDFRAEPFSFKGGAYPGTGGTCDTSLQSGASCTLVVTFAPTTLGPRHFALSLNFLNGTGGTRSAGLNLSGTGVDP
ncbi:choice-of-anchor D domain-containing protein [Archangium lipolyticum]|uniref:choice-of-anchor D domain-containing protein n=1 Tax=Archangium lipolyticum TaxID=2970465 RepID=UPI00214A0E01|nr:choice-of-anchor D domain-containing protein [Archangium lipolyticum]